VNFAGESGISDQSSSTGFECVHCWNLTRAPSGFGFRIDSFYLGKHFSTHCALLDVKVYFGEALNVGVDFEGKLIAVVRVEKRRPLGLMLEMRT